MKEQIVGVLKSFTSRKFLVAVATALLLFLDKKLGLGLSLEEKCVAAGAAGLWIVAEAVLDFKGIRNLDLKKVLATMNQVMPLVTQILQSGSGESLARGLAVGVGSASGTDYTQLMKDLAENKLSPEELAAKYPGVVSAGPGFVAEPEKPNEEAPKAGG